MRDLPSGVAVDPQLDIEPLWDRFEIFEALHHTMRIANPMSSEDLDRVVARLDPEAGEQVLDLACGYGELLTRLREQAEIVGHGVDLSPWMIQEAHRFSQDRHPDLRWTVGEGKHTSPEPTHDIVSCIGATWIWHGFNGTVRAVSDRTRPGGRIAIGEMHVRDGVDLDAAAESHGRLMSHVELDETFARHDIEIIDRVRTADASWDAYLDRVRQSAQEWAIIHPGPTAERYLAECERWSVDHARDREVLTWSVWIGRKRDQPRRAR